MSLPRDDEYEKVLFASADIQALGIMIEPDAQGNAAVVSSMLTPLQVELSGKARRKEGSRKALLEVGDVLYALNGKLLHNLPHCDVLRILKKESSQQDGVSMAVLSFIDPCSYYRLLKGNALQSNALSDEELFGKPKPATGWRDYVPSWPFTSALNTPPTKPPVRTQVERSDDTNSVDSSSSNSTASLNALSPYTNQKSMGDKAVPSGVGYLKFSKGEFEQALSVYTTVLEREPLSHTVRVSRSMCYLKLNDPEASLKDALVCCALKPEWPMAYVCKGAAYAAMNKHIDACSAYVCGLAVDPQNSVLQTKMEALFSSKNWNSIMLDGNQVVGSVASAAIQRDYWGDDMLVDRIVLYRNRRVCFLELVDSSCITLGDVGDGVSIRITNTEEYSKRLSSGSVRCELYNEDKIISVNSYEVSSVDEFISKVSSEGGVVIIGIVSGTRVAASTLLDKKAHLKTETVLSTQGRLWSIRVDGCGAVVSTGIYIPQEVKNGAYVYENQNGCLFSLERIRDEDGRLLIGWVLGRGGCILYSAILNCSELLQKLDNEEDVQLHECLPYLTWTQVHGLAPVPRLDKANIVPTLGYFNGESTATETDLFFKNVQDGFEEWTADLQILAIKGYGNRAMNNKELDLALTCFDLVQVNIEALTSTFDELSIGGLDSFNFSELDDQLSQSNEDVVDELVETAKEDYKNRLHEDENNAYENIKAKVLISKSQIHIEKGEPNEALTLVNSAIENMKVDCPMAFYTKALAEATIGLHKQALETCTKGINSLNTSGIAKQKFQGLSQELISQVDSPRSTKSDTPSIMSTPKSEIYDRHFFVESPTHKKTSRDIQHISQLYITPRAFQKDMKRMLQDGIKIDIYTTKDGVTKLKRRVLRASRDLSCLYVATKVRNTFLPGSWGRSIPRELCQGVLLGRVISNDNVDRSDSRTFTLVLPERMYCFRASSPATCTKYADVVAAWYTSLYTPGSV